MKEKIFLAYKNIDLQKFFLIEKYHFETKFRIIISFLQSSIYNQKILLTETVAKKKYVYLLQETKKRELKKSYFMIQCSEKEEKCEMFE